MPAIDYVQRMRQVRAAFLHHVYVLSQANVQTQINVKDVLQCLALTDAETDAALQFLADAGHVRPHFTWGYQKGFRLTITRAGIEAAEVINDEWRHGITSPMTPRNAEPYPDFPEIPDLRARDELYVASGWTQDGKRPGDLPGPADLPCDSPHIILTRASLLGNVAVIGSVGTGKTRAIVRPLVNQMIGKDIAGGDRWGIVLVDLRGDLTEHVRQSAAIAGRADDVQVIGFDGALTVNPFGSNESPLVIASRFLATSGAQHVLLQHPYRHSLIHEWLTHAIALLRTSQQPLHPKAIAQFLRSPEMRQRIVHEARMQWQEWQESRAMVDQLSDDRGTNGPVCAARPSSDAIEYFADWDHEDAMLENKALVEMALKQCVLPFASDVASGIANDGAATFRGFDEAFRRGRVVIIRTPVHEFGATAQTMASLLLAEACAAAKRRALLPDGASRRMVAFVLDDVPQYTHPDLADVLSVSQACGVGVILTAQSQAHVAQHGGPRMLDAVTRAVRTRISFPVITRSDAAEEARAHGMGYEQDADSGLCGSPYAYAPRLVDAFLSLQPGEMVISRFDGARVSPARRAHSVLVP